MHTSKNSTSSNEFKVAIGDEQYKNLQKKITEFIQWFDENQDASKEHYDEKFKEAENYILPIIKQSYNNKN